MFAMFNINKTLECSDGRLHSSVQAFFMPVALHSNVYGTGVPPCKCLMVLQHSRDCVGQRDRRRYFLFKNRFNMSKESLTSRLIPCGRKASAHETGCFISNPSLCYYHRPDGGRLHKRSSSTPIRAEIRAYILANFPGVRRVKVKDSGIIFIARVRLAKGRMLVRRAYSPQNLLRHLIDGLEERLSTN